MSYVHQSRKWHFLVRSLHYDYAEGYGLFLDAVLEELNKKKPQSAIEVMQSTADLMQDTKTPSIKNKILTDFGLVDYQLAFGPVADKSYGEWALDAQNQSIANYNEFISAYERGEITNLPRNLVGGFAIRTSILFADDTKARGYYDTLKRNTSLGIEESNFRMEFAYTIPETDEKIILMKIGTPHALLNDYLQMFLAKDSTKKGYLTRELLQGITYDEMGDEIAPSLDQKPKLLFLHPQINENSFNTLMKCFDPLFQKTIDATEELGARNDALTTIYWLLAQSTPVSRGGSAYARVIMEHLAYRIRENHPNFTIPYTAVGVDLWAEAATSSLGSFKERFLSGVFFDRSVTDNNVEKFLTDLTLEQMRIRSIMEGKKYLS